MVNEDVRDFKRYMETRDLPVEENEPSDMSKRG